MGIETALFGSTLLSSTAGASTVGLLGAGGAFSLSAGSLFSAGTLGALSTGLSIFSGLSSIAGGQQSYQESGYQSELALQQAESRAIEQERVSFREAKLEQEHADDFRKRQKVSFLASGVDLSGSPLLVMEETRRKGAENVNEILQSGSAAANSARAEGRVQASQLQSSGRRAFADGLSTGIGTITSGLSKYA